VGHERDERLKLNQFGYQGTPTGRSKSNSISSRVKHYNNSETADSRKSPKADSGMKKAFNLEEEDELLEIQNEE